MTGTQPIHARIYWFELANKWAIRAPVLADAHKMRRFETALRQACNAVFHHGAQAWVVDDSVLDAAKKVVAQYYRHCEVVEPPRPRVEPPPPPPPPPPPVAHVDEYDVFCALVGWRDDSVLLTFTQARRLYRRAAVRLHPDAGGSADEMAALNAAWMAIRRTLGSSK